MDIKDRRIFKSTLSILLIISLLFSVTSCKRKVKKIDSELFLATIVEQFDLEEATDGGLGSNYYSVANHIGLFQTSITVYINKCTTSSIHIYYHIYSAPNEAEDHFSALYKQHFDDDEDLFCGTYNPGKSGYYNFGNGKFLVASYYYEDMVIDIETCSEEHVEATYTFLEALGLPVE